MLFHTLCMGGFLFHKSSKTEQNNDVNTSFNVYFFDKPISKNQQRNENNTIIRTTNLTSIFLFKG